MYYCMPETVLHNSDVSMNTRDKDALPLGAYISAGDKVNNKIISKLQNMLGGVKLNKKKEWE